MGRSTDAELLAALTRRAELLSRLREGPVAKQTLVEELDSSPSTVDRAVRELSELNLVERREDGIAATIAGRFAVAHLEEFEAVVGDVADVQPVLSTLPRDAPIGPGAVAGGEAYLATEPAPYRPVEHLYEAVNGAERYRALLPRLDGSRHVRLLHEHVVTRERPADLVVTDELFETLRGGFPQRMAAMADCEGFELRVAGDLPPFAVVLAGSGDDATVGIVVFAEEGAVHGVVLNDSESAVKWAEDHYAAGRDRATIRTRALTHDRA